MKSLFEASVFALGVRKRLTATMGHDTPTLAEKPSFYTFVITTFTDYHKNTGEYILDGCVESFLPLYICLLHS